jgi:hypothetical protein
MRTENIRLYLFYLGILLTIIGLPFSRAMLSIGQVTMGVVFLFDTNLISKIKLFFKNKATLSFVSFYILLWIGSIYSDNLNYAFFDLRTKLPLLIFPLVFATEKPLKAGAIRFFLLIFVATVITSVSTSLWIYISKNLADYREAFPFVSHIRISLEIIISISILVSYTFIENKPFPIWLRVLFVFAIIYLLWANIILELMTGFVILLITLVISLIYFLTRNKNTMWLKFFSGGTIILILSISFWVFKVVKDYSTVPHFDINKLESKTKLGNKYEHLPHSYQIENGSYIGIYTQWDEMREAWNKRSKLDFDGKDRQNQGLRFTLQRYLNSKHLRKDAEGVESLSNQDIQNIEEGIANFEFAKKFSYKKRIYKILWEYGMYQRGETVYGHTLIQRIELWKTAWSIFVEKPLFGVGTGDIPDAFEKKFIDNNSPLQGSKLRSHNEYLSVLVSLGIFGLIVFLFSIFYPPFYLGLWDNQLLFLFICFLSISMLWEDTIETQVGVTIFSFFYSFYIFGRINRSS